MAPIISLLSEAASRIRSLPRNTPWVALPRGHDQERAPEAQKLLDIDRTRKILTQLSGTCGSVDMAPVNSADHDGDMSRRTAGWIASAITGPLVAGLIAYFITVGLNKADMVASTVASVTGLISLTVAVWGLFPSRSSSDGETKLGATQNVKAGRDAYASSGDMSIDQRRSDKFPS